MAESPATSVTFSTDENSKAFSYIPTLGVCTVKYSQPSPNPVPNVTVFFSGNGHVVTHDNLFSPERIISPGSFSFVGNNKDVLALTLHEDGQRDDDHRYGIQVSYEWTYSDPTSTPTPTTENGLGLGFTPNLNGLSLSNVSVSQLSPQSSQTEIEDTTPPTAFAFLQSAKATGKIEDPNISAIIVLTASDSQSGLGRILLDKNGQNINFNFFDYDRTTYTDGTPLSVFFGDAKNGDVYTFTVPDKAGNIAFASVTVMIEGVQIVPSISVMSPDDNSFNKGNVELMARDNSQLTFVISGPKSLELSSEVSTGIQNVNLSDLPEGQYVWWAENQDGMKSPTRSFSVDTTPPQVHITSKWLKPGQVVGRSISSSAFGNPSGALHIQIVVEDNGSGIGRPSGLAINGRGKTGRIPTFYEWSDYYGQQSGNFNRLDNYVKDGDVHTFYFKDVAGNEGSSSVTVVELEN
jgi:hypothetical protein